LQTNVPVSPEADFCNDDYCSNVILLTNGGASFFSCANPSTRVNGPTYRSQDLLTSTDPNCYPIVATVDYSTYQGVQPASSDSDSYIRVQFGGWLFSNEDIQVPLEVASIALTSSQARGAAYKQMCHIAVTNDETGDSNILGYTYCGYQDCSWEAGDFEQVVSDCDPATMTQTAVYVLKNSSTCLPNELLAPASAKFPCPMVPVSSPLGASIIFLSIFGVAISSLLIFTSFYVTGSQPHPLFMYCSMAGGIALNCAILVFVGPNSDSMCLLRPWVFDLTSTLLFAPLVVKLSGIYILASSASSLKKINFTDNHVGQQVVGMLAIDAVLLILWTVIAKPKSAIKFITHPSVLDPVATVVCNTNISSLFEILMVTYKSLLLGGAAILASLTWSVPISRYTAIASYNLAIVGGGVYFLSTLIEKDDPGIAVLMRCLAIFICSTFAMVVILVPRILSTLKKGMVIKPSNSVFVKPSKTLDTKESSSSVVLARSEDEPKEEFD